MIDPFLGFPKILAVELACLDTSIFYRINSLLLEDVLLNLKYQMIFQDNKALHHFSIVQKYINDTFPVCIERRCIVPWPTQSLDLTSIK